MSAALTGSQAAKLEEAREALRLFVDRRREALLAEKYFLEHVLDTLGPGAAVSEVRARDVEAVTEAVSVLSGALS